MPDLSLNLEIKGIGSTTMSMEDAKKLYHELRVLFEEKVKYVHDYGWNWYYPWWGYTVSCGGTYSGGGGAQLKSATGQSDSFTLGMMNEQASGSVPSSYSIKI